MSLVKILGSSSLIIKSDGVYFLGGENAQFMHFPPEHILNPDPNQPDHPAWSYHPETGELLEGGIHPIDGVARHLQEYLDKNKGDVHAIDIINKAIQAFNADHSPAHQLPVFDSPEWRKMVVGPYPGTRDSGSVPVRTSDGKLVTHWSSKGGSKLGTFLETGSVPFYAHLGHLLEQMGLPRGRDAVNEFTEYPHISPHHLSPNVYRAGKNELGQSGILPHGALQRYGPEGMTQDMAMGGQHTWQVAHHLPPIFFSPIAPKPREGEGSALLRSMHGHVRGALENIPPDAIPDTQISIRGPSGGLIQTNLRDALLNPDSRDALLRDMARSPASNLLFHRGGALGSKVRNLFENHFTPEDNEKYLNLLSHGTSKTKTQDKGTHSFAPKIAAAAWMAGPHSEDESKSALSEHKIGHSGEEDESEINRRKDIILGLSQVMMTQHNEQPFTPDWNNMPSQGVFGARINQMQAPTNVPKHIAPHFYTGMEMAPITPMHLREGEPGGRRPPSPPERTPPTRPEMAPAPPPATPSVGPRPLPESVMETKRRLGEMQPMEAADRARAAGANIPRGQEGTFHQLMGDPYQTMLPQFYRSDESLEMLDRIEKAMEKIQLLEAVKNPEVIKHIPNSGSLNLEVESDVSLMAEKLGLTKHDIRSLAISKGDWLRVADVFKVPEQVVGIVKVAFR